MMVFHINKNKTVPMFRFIFIALLSYIQVTMSYDVQSHSPSFSIDRVKGRVLVCI